MAPLPILGGNHMNEEPIEPSQDDIRYYELFECSHDELVKRLLSCEDALTANENELHRLQQENDAIKLLLYPGRHDILIKGRGIGNPTYYFHEFYKATKQDVIIKLMDADRKLFENDIISEASSL
jgi:hypothetical protein